MEKNIFDAIDFAAKAHRNHFRKASRIPYITHLSNVMKVLIEFDYPEEVAMAGMLHDVIEDTDVTYEDVLRNFGEQVALLVKGATEPAKLQLSDGEEEAPWKERKEHTLAYVSAEQNEYILAVTCADKLDNIRSILADLQRTGNGVWQRFNAPFEEQRWYYTALADIFHGRQQEFGHSFKALTDELRGTVSQVFEVNQA